MRVDYDAVLVEHAVFEAGRRDPELEAEIHQATDPLYEIDDLRKRDAHFAVVCKTFFQRLELDHPLAQLLAEHPLIERAVHRCVVRKAPRSRQEMAELYIKHDLDTGTWMRTIIIQVCPHSLLNPEKLGVKMRRELMQIADMLDERFGYRRDSLAGRLPRENLIRDRYRVLWDIYAQGRLARSGHGNETVMAALAVQLRHVFAGPWADRASVALNGITLITGVVAFFLIPLSRRDSGKAPDG